MTAPPSSIRALLSDNPTYRKLWLGQLVSLVGDFFNLTALMTAVAAASPPGQAGRHVGLLLVLNAVPSVLVSAFAGVVVDRFDRRRVMIVCDVVRAVFAFLLCFATGPGGLPALYALVVALVVFSTFFEPARSALLPDVVAPHELVAANELGAATWSLSFALGSLLGGVVCSAFGFQAAFVFNGASYLASALLVGSIHPAASHRAPPGGARAGFLADLAAAGRYIAGDRIVAALMTVKPTWALGSAIGLVLVVYGSTLFPIGQAGAVSIGLLNTCRAIGTLLGPLLSRSLTQGQPDRMLRLIPFAYAFGAAFTVLFARAPTLAIAGGCLVMSHMGGSTLWIFSSTLLQRRVPSGLRGRVFAFEMASFTLTLALSSMLGGLGMDLAHLSPRAIAGAVALVYAAPVLPWVLALPSLTRALAPQ